MLKKKKYNSFIELLKELAAYIILLLVPVAGLLIIWLISLVAPIDHVTIFSSEDVIGTGVIVGIISLYFVSCIVALITKIRTKLKSKGEIITHDEEE